MKKLLCLVITLVLCFGCTVSLAGSSKTTDDMTYVADMGGVEDLEISLLSEDDPRYEPYRQPIETVLANLAAAESVEAYFGSEAESEFKAVLGEGPYSVHELAPLLVENYDPEKHGDVQITLNFPTPYARGQKVIVMIGLITTQPDGTSTVEWFAYEGTVVANGRIQFTLDSEMMLAIQNGLALIAIVSK